MAQAYYNTSSTGTNFVKLTPDMVGAAAASHTHPYLPLSGGTLTGAVNFNAKNNTFACYGASWISGKTATNVPIVFPAASTTDGSRYDPYMWGQNYKGDVWNFGAGANNEICFVGFSKDRTDNGTDWKWGINIETGMLTDPEVCIQSTQPTNKNAKLWVKI